nr:DUF3718 domain-containing protein [uncultured Glaciecola sp.]
MYFSKVKLMMVVITLTTTNIATAGNSRLYVANDNSIETRICVAAATGSKLRLKSQIDKISSSKLMSPKYRMVANQLNCNGINVADFATLAGNIEVANKLRSYRSNSVEIRDIAAVYNGNVTINGSY